MVQCRMVQKAKRAGIVAHANGLTAEFSHIQSLAEITTFIDTKWLWTLSHPTFFLFNRYMTALLGTATVVLTAVLGRRLGESTGCNGTGRWAGR